ncbi:methyl-accepting chemotaxis protein [Hydrogenispora ethanolica]|uniref:Methyl-accepting chemotaxis protein n=1 Tax=Hydrogenispora ethanolica TaxID=1082276 RepID=A0A4R1RTN9_HYDET|nr:methyl-accepting chemotaxis protein [Hydrogenispora ethanolica]TCL69908.1 methyl-accepting chemotaxis protein [Hydrogenispora ethanolica]
MLKDMEVGKKLALGFGIVGLLIIMMAVYSIFGLVQIDQGIKKVVEDRMPKTIWANEISENTNVVARALRNMLLWNDPSKVTEEEKRIVDSTAKIERQLKKLEQTIHSDEGKKVLQKVLAAYNEYNPALAHLRQRIHEGKKAEAIALLFTEMRQKQNAYLQTLSDLVTFQTALMSESGQQAYQLIQRTTFFLILISVICLILACGITLLMTRSITGPLKECVDVAEKVAQGDISFTIEVQRKDEPGLVLVAMKTMTESIRNMLKDATELVEAAKQGMLSTRADAVKHQGDFRKIIEGFNHTLDAMVQPVQEASQVLQEMAQGNLQTAMNGDYQGDHAVIKDALNHTILSIRNYIAEISAVLTAMAGGDLNVAIQSDYRGDFVQIKDSLNRIIDSFNEILGEFYHAADQVASGAKHVSDSSQILSQAATEQASTVQEITASMTEIAAQTKQNAVNANQASELAVAAKGYAIEGDQQMGVMLNSMESINEASGNISKIIKVIDEIAFQTNILALNAAVEAARAGQHGRGFAVVAEEVRNLAARSADAAKETTALIEGSIQKVESGTLIANHTAEALNRIVDGITEAASLIGNIATSSNEQASGITQVDQGISQVAQVTQTNTATAEQCASASEELSSQADLLKSMVQRFKLRKQRNAQRMPGDANSFTKPALEVNGLDCSLRQVAAAVQPFAPQSSAEFGKY